MGLLDTLKSWLGVGTDGKTDDQDKTTSSSEEPKLDPNGATETRIETTDAAVDALKQTQDTAEKMTNTGDDGAENSEK